MSNLLSSAQCAERLGLSIQTVIKLAETGSLKSSFIQRRWKFEEADIQEFVQSQRRGK